METYRERYHRYKTLIDENLFILSEKKSPSSVYEPIKYILTEKGKRIRPVLMMLCCDTAGGNAESFINTASAIEVLHNFTLVHDDIMDNADTRRGRESVHKKWNVNTAILAGDAMIGLAYKAVLSDKSARKEEILSSFTEGMIEVCEGQGYDKEFESADNVTIDDYLKMIRKKTSKLLEMSALVGGYCADAEFDVLNKLKEFSYNLGLAFQIHDDILDITADEAQFGKKCGGDIIEGKRTYLTIKAIAQAEGSDSEKMNSVLNRNLQKDNISIEDIKGIYNKYGIIEDAKKQVEIYTSKAEECISEINSENKHMLLEFSNMLLNRTY